MRRAAIAANPHAHAGSRGIEDDGVLYIAAAIVHFREISLDLSAAAQTRRRLAAPRKVDQRCPVRGQACEPDAVQRRRVWWNVVAMAVLKERHSASACLLDDRVGRQASNVRCSKRKDNSV